MIPSAGSTGAASEVGAEGGQERTQRRLSASNTVETLQTTFQPLPLLIRALDLPGGDSRIIMPLRRISSSLGLVESGETLPTAQRDALRACLIPPPPVPLPRQVQDTDLEGLTPDEQAERIAEESANLLARKIGLLAQIQDAQIQMPPDQQRIDELGSQMQAIQVRMDMLDERLAELEEQLLAEQQAQRTAQRQAREPSSGS